MRTAKGSPMRVSNRLYFIFLASLLLFYSHGVEEILTGFQHSDYFMIVGASLFDTTPERFYWISHIAYWLLVPAFFLMLRDTPVILPLMGLFGLAFFVEIHHPIKALLVQSYYPGMLTALLYPLIGLIYWRQLVRDWRTVL